MTGFLVINSHLTQEWSSFFELLFCLLAHWTAWKFRPRILHFFQHSLLIIIWNKFSQIRKVIPSPLCPSPRQSQGGACGQRRGCIPPSSTCLPPIQVFYPLLWTSAFFSYQTPTSQTRFIGIQQKEKNELTAIPARIRLMWLLRMSAWLRTWKQKFYASVYLSR